MSCQKNLKGGDEDKSCLNQNLEKEMLDKQSIYIQGSNIIPFIIILLLSNQKYF